jgi:predicted nucleic acid-binding protein
VRWYLDSSALVKRSIDEPESDPLEDSLAAHVGDGGALVSSSLAWIEVGRALRSRIGVDYGQDEARQAVDDAFSGVAERPIGADVVGLARRVVPTTLRTLDAIHLATAILLDVDLVVTYDDRLAEACRHNGLATAAPSS